jgi:uncharacterized protein
MVALESIYDYARCIEQEFHPQRIVLFGSYGRGTPSPDSDVDLLVVMSFEGKPWKAAAAIRGRVRPRFPLDLVVRTPEQIRERLKRGDTYLQTLLREGVVLHEG